MNLLLISCIYLAFSSQEVQRRLMQTACMLLIQLASTNCFYSMWQLNDDVFYKSLSLPWDSFQPPCSRIIWNKWFEISPYFNSYFYNTNTKVKVQCKYQSSKMRNSHIVLKTLQSAFTRLNQFSSLLLFFDAPHYSL